MKKDSLTLQGLSGSDFPETEVKESKATPVPFIPMFFSMDAIANESLYILEINSGYMSGFGLGDETYITYLQTCRRSGPVIIVCNDEVEVITDELSGEQASDFEKMTALAKEVLTQEEREKIHFVPYKLHLKEIVSSFDQKVSIIKEKYSSDATQSAWAYMQLNKNMFSEVVEARRKACHEISILIKKFCEQQLNNVWLKFTPTVVPIHPQKISPSLLKNALLLQGISYPVDSASLVFELQCYDKALQRISQKKMMAAGELLDIRTLGKIALGYKYQFDGMQQLQTGRELLTLYRKVMREQLTRPGFLRVKNDLKLAEEVFNSFAEEITSKSQMELEQKMRADFEAMAEAILAKLGKQTADIELKRQDFPRQVILKPTSGCRGEGVIICPAEASQLGATLLQLAECLALTLQKNNLMTLAECKQSLSLPAGGELGDNIAAKLQELVTQTLRHTGFFLIEEWMPSEPVLVPEGKKLATWRFVVETLDQQFTVKRMKQGAQPKFTEQERRVYGKLPPLALTSKENPTTGECVSYIPDTESKNSKQEQQLYLPDQLCEEKLLQKFSEIRQPLQQSLQAGFYEYLKELNQSPIEYQQHFCYLVPFFSTIGIFFSTEDISDAQRFLENNQNIDLDLEEILEQIVDVGEDQTISKDLQASYRGMFDNEQHHLLENLKSWVKTLESYVQRDHVRERSNDISEVEIKGSQDSFQLDNENPLEKLRSLLLNYTRPEQTESESDEEDSKLTLNQNLIPYPALLEPFIKPGMFNSCVQVLQGLHRIENSKGTFSALITAHQFCLWAKSKNQSVNVTSIQGFIDSHLK